MHFIRHATVEGAVQVLRAHLSTVEKGPEVLLALNVVKYPQPSVYNIREVFGHESGLDIEQKNVQMSKFRIRIFDHGDVAHVAEYVVVQVARLQKSSTSPCSRLWRRLSKRLSFQFESSRTIMLSMVF
eukprot:gnl/TRDRNA2_/TRDRNA2_116158_c0_seq1.p1 gnl/TRDRNA2_/TRDRNA2_116158_c0~~gnl/TRDRNA2_/TRDRNA2_116158_c0_seq1.p1  ORF type:complete len:128 (-),score=9.55 gnl/TRDRNA2_/TRDRNA2_116158_c0_seq1:23-406(-)